MIRIVGILIGSAIAVAILIVALGVPNFATTEPAGDGFPATENVASEEVAAKVPHTEPVEGGLPATEELATEVPPTEPAGGDLPVTEDFSTEEIVAIDPHTDPTGGDLPATDENWYAFWSPFRSEIAANGFVSRLQQTTGMDYRVVKLKPGVYEVAFAYADEADIEDKLARISDATGLDMTGG